MSPDDDIGMAGSKNGLQFSSMSGIVESMKELGRGSENLEIGHAVKRPPYQRKSVYHPRISLREGPTVGAVDPFQRVQQGVLCLRPQPMKSLRHCLRRTLVAGSRRNMGHEDFHD